MSTPVHAPEHAPDAGPGAAPDAAPGLDVGRLERWFAAHVPGAAPPLTFELVAGGRSNLTFRVVEAGGRTFALRRPPLGHVLPTAHDMAREHRIMSALGPTPVPVPRTLGLCEDQSVTGAPFYVMEFVDGHVLRDAAGAEATFPLEVRRPASDHLADTLAALHAVDVDQVGLGDLARRDGYIERQLRRWRGQFQQMGGAEAPYGPAVERVAKALAAGIPAQRVTTVVHGDYRVDNVVLADDGSVAAVLDWELCTLGEPMADVGLFLDYWAVPADGAPLLGRVPATALPGFATVDEVLARYAQTSGRDVSDISYFMAFGYWKLACILQGVYARYVGGAAGGDPDGVEHVPPTLERLAELAATTLAAP